MRFDPYEVLGLKCTATSAQIKNAFRKRAKATHPDHGGSSEEFSKVMRANLILSDTERRKKYDTTGEVDDRQPEQSVPAAMMHIIGFFSAAITFASSQNHEAFTLDLVDAAKQNFTNNIDQLEKNKKVPLKSIALTNKMLKQLKAKSETDILLVALRNNIREFELTIRNLDNTIEQFKDAIVLLRDYKFMAEKMPEPMYGVSGTPRFFTSGAYRP